MIINKISKPFHMADSLIDRLLAKNLDLIWEDHPDKLGSLLNIQNFYRAKLNEIQLE